MWSILGILGAILLHGALLLFGGILFFGDGEQTGRLQQVELLGPEQPAKDEPQQKPPEERELEAEKEPPPDATEILRNLETPPEHDAPALDAASLSALEQALGSQGAGDGFADALSLASGGRLGGTGKAGALDESLEAAFSLTEIDQQPRAVFQASPLYPAEMRGRKLEGVVSVLFVVDKAGKVADPRVEKANHPAFQKPALAAVRQWKFEAAVKGGQRVPCRMRVSIRFPPS